MRIRTKTNLPQLLFALFVVALLFIVAWVAKQAITGGHTTTGELVSYSYNAGSNSSTSVGVVNGETVVLVNPGTAPSYKLVLRVEGQVGSYSVGPNTYARAVEGQTEFRMLCTNLVCMVAE